MAWLKISKSYETWYFVRKYFCRKYFFHIYIYIYIYLYIKIKNHCSHCLWVALVNFGSCIRGLKGWGKEDKLSEDLAQGAIKVERVGCGLNCFYSFRVNRPFCLKHKTYRIYGRFYRIRGAKIPQKYSGNTGYKMQAGTTCE